MDEFIELRISLFPCMFIPNPFYYPRFCSLELTSTTSSIVEDFAIYCVAFYPQGFFLLAQMDFFFIIKGMCRLTSSIDVFCALI